MFVGSQLHNNLNTCCKVVDSDWPFQFLLQVIGYDPDYKAENHKQ